MAPVNQTLVTGSDTPTTKLRLEHSERNVNNLTSLLDHADELYLAELSERTNQETFWLVLAGLSLSITLFALPSFWADLTKLNGGQALQPFQPGTIQWVGTLGDILPPVLILGSLAIALTATYRFVSFRTRQRRWHRRRRHLDLSQDLL